MKVRDIMTTKALFDTKETDTLASAAHRMFWARCRHLPVTKGKQVVGVLSEKDVLTWQAQGHGLDGPNDRVSAVMSAPPTVAVPDEELAEAAARMIASRIDCLPVVMHGRLVGMLTTTDLLGRLVTETFAPAARGDAPAVAVMSPRFLTALSSDPLLEAAETMVANHIRHLPVVDETGHLVGILSERDLRTALGRPREAITHWLSSPSNRTVRDVMTSPAISIRAEQPLSQVIATMVDGGVGALPVVDRENHPIGIVSYPDVLRAVRLVA